MRVLLIEDDPVLQAGLKEALVGGGLHVDPIGAAEPGELALKVTSYDLAIVDIGLPGMDGFEFIRRIRARGHKLPVLVLTARDALHDRVVGLDTGADDYLVKPFLLPELLARVRALIRRSCDALEPLLTVGDLTLDSVTLSVQLGGRDLELTRREWGVVEQLVRASPKVVSKQRLVDSLSQWDKEVTPNAVEIYISRLRSKLDASRVMIRTIRGIGYRLEEIHPDG